VVEFVNGTLEGSIFNELNYIFGPDRPVFKKFHFVASPSCTHRPGFKSGTIPSSAHEVTVFRFGGVFAAS
jgi:hypothetical protein